jgi:peptidylprolyl isomerase
MVAVKNGDRVQIHYTGTLGDGSIFDSTVGREPLVFTLGSGQVIAGIEEAVLGMNEGESKKITVPVDKGYGPHNAELVIMASKSQVPPDLKPEIGQKFQLGGPNGELIVVQVVDMSESHITLDANPPLAGKELMFDIELVAIG